MEIPKSSIPLRIRLGTIVPSDLLVVVSVQKLSGFLCRFCYPEISSPPDEDAWREVGMEQREKIPGLHEAGPVEGGADSQAEGEGSSKLHDSRLDGGLCQEGPGAPVRLQGHGTIPELKRPGRKRVGTNDEERRIIADAYARYEVNALTLERVIDANCGRHIPHNRIHEVLKEMSLARNEPRKQLRRKWVKYERKYSNSLWHTDWTLIEGKG